MRNNLFSMLSDSFIIDLVSNGSMDIYKDNTIAAFTNLLPEHIELDGKWEVALLEVSYPSLFNNITDGEFLYVDTIKFPDGIKCKIHPGMYHSVDDVSFAMIQAVKVYTKDSSLEDKDLWELFLLVQNRKCLFKTSDHCAIVLLSDDLSHIFGYEKFPSTINPMNKSLSKYPSDICRFHSVIAYVDIIEHAVIGDIRAPVLRSFPYGTKLKSSNKVISYYADERIRIETYMTHLSFTDLQYRKLSKNSFNQISVMLRDQTGSLLPFIPIGFSRLTLSFRKIQ